jgi:hypothetical protein
MDNFVLSNWSISVIWIIIQDIFYLHSNVASPANNLWTDELFPMGKTKTTFFYAIGVWPVLDIFNLGGMFTNNKVA